MDIAFKSMSFKTQTKLSLHAHIKVAYIKNVFKKPQNLKNPNKLLKPQTLFT